MAWYWIVFAQKASNVQCCGKKNAAFFAISEFYSIFASK